MQVERTTENEKIVASSEEPMIVDSSPTIDHVGNETTTKNAPFEISPETTMVISTEDTSPPPSSPSSHSPENMDTSVLLEWHKIQTDDVMSYGSDESFPFESEDELLHETEPMAISKPFDMLLLKTSIQNGSATLDQVTNKDIVLVVGKTGSGKSTLIQGIAGKQLKAAVHTAVSNGQTFRKEVFEAEDPLDGFEIGHAMTSKTKSINCFERPTGKGDSVMMYVDSPGFEDTEGHEMDIATSVMLSQVAKKCKSLRFVILMNYASLLEDRGGAMCAVLKFTRAFVRDFNEEKKSFLFLFSHTKGILPDSINEARKRLLGDIVHIYQGTSDEDVKTVLSFLRESLEKRYPFVDIFHPLKQDMSKLVKFIETKLSPVKNPTLAANCGLTMPSHFKLVSQVKTMLLDLKHLLSRSPVDIGRIKEIRETLGYLGQHIDFVDICNAAKECNSAIDHFCSQGDLVITEEINRGTDLEHDFSPENTKALRSTMYHLFELDNLSADSFSARLTLKLILFRERVLNEPCDSFCKVPLKLQKLETWATAFPEYISLYRQALNRFEDVIGRNISESASFDGASLQDASEEQVTALIQNYRLFESVSANKEGLAEHSLNVDGAMEAYHASKNEILTILSDWGVDMGSMMHTDDLPQKELLTLAIRAKVLDVLRSLLEEYSICFELQEKVRFLAFAIETRVVDHYQESVVNFAAARLTLHKDSAQRIEVLITSSSYFVGLRGIRWRETGFACSAIIASVQSKIVEKEKAVDTAAKHVSTHGIVDGLEEGNTLLSFDRCILFDDLLQQKDRFVKNISKKFHAIYHARMSKVEKEVRFSLEDLVSPLRDSIKALDQLKTNHREVQEISKFAGVIGEEKYSSLDAVFHSNIDKYIDKLGPRIQASLECWTKLVDMKSTNNTMLLLKTRKLGDLLFEIDQLSQVGAYGEFHAKALHLESETTCVLNNFSGKLKAEFKTSGNYPLLATRLSFIEACGSSSWTSNYLPDLEGLKVLVAAMVSKDAQAIEKLIETSAKWDEIDKLLTKLEKGKVVDRFVDGQVTSHLGPLLKLRHQKEEKVDSLLVELIEKQDFTGIGEFIGPLAQSKDQLKQIRFKQHREAICRSLTETIHSITCTIDSGLTDATVQQLGKRLRGMEDAQRDLGKHLKGGGVDLDVEIRKLKKAMNCRLLKFVENFREAAKEANFVKMAISTGRAVFVVGFVGDYASASTRREIIEVSKRFDMKVQSLSDHLDEFFDSRFSDGSDFLRILSGMKVASENSHSATNELTKVYHKATKTLTERLKTSLESLKRDVDEHYRFDDGIEIIRRLIRELNGGLAKHTNIADLPFDCSMKLQEWQKCLRNDKLDLEFQGPGTESKMKTWSKKLDKLRSPSMFQFVRDLVGGSTTYKGHCELLDRLVTGKFSHGIESLDARDFSEIQQCIEFLDLVSCNLKDHVPNAAHLSSQLQKDVQTAFLDSVETAVSVLRDRDLNRFEGLFQGIRGFVLYVPCASEATEATKKYKLVNQLVFEILNSQVKSVLNMLAMESHCFDFPKIRSALEEARVFGGFVADHYSLFYEEIKISQPATEDKWLAEISSLCHEHFSFGRRMAYIKQCAILGVIPSASEQEIGRGYRRKALLYHPDKHQGKLSAYNSAKFRLIKEAQDVLLQADSHSEARPFDCYLGSVSNSLRKRVQECLVEQRYEVVEKVLFSLPALCELKNMITPELDCEKIQDGVEELVRNHVCKVKVEVGSLWAIRKYRDLNDTIVDLRLMEKHFTSHPTIFPSSWNDGIVEIIELEIKKLGKEACGFLSSKATAKENQNEFRRCIIHMGSVLVELPLLKKSTKMVMSDVFESCLRAEWGFSYLFELGLSLERGDDNTDENEARVAHFILAEFSHFKEVLTMAWNTETTQKPAEDTVMRITANRLENTETSVDINRDALLRSFVVFEKHYSSLLGEYIRPEADLNALIKRTLAICKMPSPITCEGGWNEKVRDKIPQILAGVFALFTVLKSGESFNRIESSEQASKLGEQVLLKPHNIQVLTLLYMFGCSSPISDCLDSQLLQIRTGEGKSMILGAAATVLGLLGFKVRCVCYSEYLSSRDYALFEKVFDYFGLCNRIKYSKITALSEDMTAAKGDIRALTTSLLRGHVAEAAPPFQLRRTGIIKQTENKRTVRSENNKESTIEALADLKASRPVVSGSIATASLHGGLSAKGRCGSLTGGDNNPFVSLETQNQTAPRQGAASEDLATEINDHLSSSDVFHMTQHESGHNLATEEEILLVDEVDVFFGSDFYGRTYNQVTQIQEPEIRDILKYIWDTYKKTGRKQRLVEIKAMSAYKQLIMKLPNFEFLLENEIALMLDQVRAVDDEPYSLDENDRIGYKVMDTICYDVTYGYRTVFAYLKESDAGNLKERDRTLEKVLCMNVSCGQFSYADICPTRILGVSGTLEATGEFEKGILRKYGIDKFIFMPSVYGMSNFDFQKAGEGIFIEASKSDYFHKICSEISSMTKQKRAVIVFFRDALQLNEFESSAFYRKLGRQKTKLSEDMSPDEKDFVIKKAATAGQVTICSAVFGRGTDFFCKDQQVQESGGVHIIQTFLSVEKSEEIQIQGRTARQGKRGTFQMILLDSDLENTFELCCAEKEKIPKPEWYDWLCAARDKQYKKYCSEIEDNLTKATKRDIDTHKYFDALIMADQWTATKLFKDLYFSMKKRPMPSSIEIDLCCAIDVSGSMGPYMAAACQTMKSLVQDKNSIVSKLRAKFPEINFKLRMATLAFRDIEDNDLQFQESLGNPSGHFNESTLDALRFMENATSNPSGGFDLAEDLLGAVHRCANWNEHGDWTGAIKFIMLLTDAPAHCMVSPCSTKIFNADNFATLHPEGLTAEIVVDTLVSKDIDLFFCSFNPLATAFTEDQLSKAYLNHSSNTEEREVTVIPMIPKQTLQPGVGAISSGQCQHIIFVLDASGSMSHDWSGVVVAYKNFVSRRIQNQSMSDVVSVVQFDSTSKITVDQQQISVAPTSLAYSGGGTVYAPAAEDARRIALKTPDSHVPVVVFMSDGEADEADAVRAAFIFTKLNQEIRSQTGSDLELHVIAFGLGLDQRQLQQITRSSSNGRIHTSAGTAQLSNIFVDIAQNSQNVAMLLEEEIGRRISDAVTDKLSLEYLG